MRKQMPQGCILPQLRREMRSAGVEDELALHYHPDERWIEIDSESSVVWQVVADHDPDPVKALPPERRELLGLIEAQEVRTLDPREKPRFDRLLAAYVRDQILGGVS
jgi:hypothetical protein